MLVAISWCSCWRSKSAKGRTSPYLTCCALTVKQWWQIWSDNTVQAVVTIRWLQEGSKGRMGRWASEIGPRTSGEQTSASVRNYWAESPVKLSSDERCTGKPLENWRKSRKFLESSGTKHLIVQKVTTFCLSSGWLNREFLIEQKCKRRAY